MRAFQRWVLGVGALASLALSGYSFSRYESVPVNRTPHEITITQTPTERAAPSATLAISPGEGYWQAVSGYLGPGASNAAIAEGVDSLAHAQGRLTPAEFDARYPAQAYSSSAPEASYLTSHVENGRELNPNLVQPGSVSAEPLEGLVSDPAADGAVRSTGTALSDPQSRPFGWLFTSVVAAVGALGLAGKAFQGDFEASLVTRVEEKNNAYDRAAHAINPGYFEGSERAVQGWKAHDAKTRAKREALDREIALREAEHAARLAAKQGPSAGAARASGPSQLQSLLLLDETTPASGSATAKRASVSLADDDAYRARLGAMKQRAFDNDSHQTNQGYFEQQAAAAEGWAESDRRIANRERLEAILGRETEPIHSDTHPAHKVLVYRVGADKSKTRIDGPDVEGPIIYRHPSLPPWPDSASDLGRQDRRSAAPSVRAVPSRGLERTLLKAYHTAVQDSNGATLDATLDEGTLSSSLDYGYRFLERSGYVDRLAGDGPNRLRGAARVQVQGKAARMNRLAAAFENRYTPGYRGDDSESEASRTAYDAMVADAAEGLGVTQRTVQRYVRELADLGNATARLYLDAKSAERSARGSSSSSDDADSGEQAAD